jgi:hypothetical protein
MAGEHMTVHLDYLMVPSRNIKLPQPAAACRLAPALSKQLERALDGFGVGLIRCSRHSSQVASGSV